MRTIIWSKAHSMILHLIRIKLTFLLVLCISCKRMNNSSHDKFECPFEYIKNEKNTKLTHDIISNNTNLAINLPLLKKANINLVDTFRYQELDRIIKADSVDYSKDFLEKHNGLVQILCHKYYLISQMDSLDRNEQIKELYKSIDDYIFNDTKHILMEDTTLINIKESANPNPSTSVQTIINNSNNPTVINQPNDKIIINQNN
ncbi:MAG: hypothetical protein R2852_10080 [Bacteroidia bacterium]